MRILAIDPGPTECGYVVLKSGAVVEHGVRPVDDIDRESVFDVIHRLLGVYDGTKTNFVVEMVASYGMAVGIEVFETCVNIGRICEFGERGPYGTSKRVYRSTIKHHLCGSAKAKDANVRQALIDRFGPGRELAIGTKKNPGPLYGISSHCWAALALAVTYQDLGEAACVDPAREMAAKSARRQLKREKRKAKEASK